MKKVKTVKVTKRILSKAEGDCTKALRRIVIMRDTDPQNPRKEWDNVFKVYSDCKYLDSDEGALNPVVDYGTSPDKAEFYNGVYGIPLYAHVHSGMVLSLAPFADKWDSGCAGFMYVNKAEFCKEFNLKRFSAKRAMKVAQGEVDAMNQYISNEVYGYVEQTRENPEAEWEDGDSCWGFFGSDYIGEMVAQAGGAEIGTIICEDGEANLYEGEVTMESAKPADEQGNRKAA